MNISSSSYQKFLNTWWLLKLTYGLVYIVAGLDKIFMLNIIVTWSKYISPFINGLLPTSIPTFILIVGILEIVIGLMVLTQWTRLGSYLLAAWLFIIAINLFTMGIYLDLVVRDIVMAIGAVALAWLTEIKEHLIEND